uniref:Nucleic acid binding protein n=1 Tax=Carrot carlavirus WM-2008 TaxID=552517 RepID=B5AZR8_9VIRU|nr:nucleic acid binding protein [Carrot carlavirus WM-2008]
MHKYNLHVLCALNKAEPKLPAQVIEIIWVKSSIHRENYILSSCKPKGTGTSKSSVKRRAARFGRCANCGRYSHNGACKWSTSQSNSEFKDFLQIGAINYCNERPIRKNSVIEQVITSERLRLLNIKDVE